MGGMGSVGMGVERIDDVTWVDCGGAAESRLRQID